MSASPWLYQVIIVAMSALLPTALAWATVTAPIKHSHRHNLIETERVKKKTQGEVEKLARYLVSFPLSLSHTHTLSLFLHKE